MGRFETRLRVRSYELDGLGHVNHAVYLNYFELARFEALEAGGWAAHRMDEKGWGVVVVRIEVDYLKECRQGDRLRITTRADSFRRTSMVLEHELFVTPMGGRGGADTGNVEAGDGGTSEAWGTEALSARARVTAVWIGADGRPTRIPDVVREAFGHPDGGEAPGKEAGGEGG
jgi:YbgC/YbaW family acyl-CoA thioester hydrolase